jgi:uncharacterized iron-regulated membrane protein
MIVEIFLSSVSSFIGVIFLWIKFRGKKSIKELRKEAEEDSFAFEGGKVILFIVGMIMLFATLTFLFVVIYRIIVHL